MNGVDEKDENKVKSISDKPPIKWIFVLSAVVIIPAFFALIISTYFIRTNISDNPLFQYRVTIALVCFVLSTISALLFATRVKIKSTVGLVSITIVGPAALWLAALFIFNNIIFQQSAFENLPVDEYINQLSLKTEKREGWQYYCDWKHHLELIKSGNMHEEGFIKTMLSRVYYHGLKGYNKLKDVNIQTLFVYLGKEKSIKFQIIKGKKIGDPTNIYMAAEPSFKLDPDKVIARYIQRNERGDLVGDGIVGQRVEYIPKIIDCLIIALYKEELDKGDWIYVDLPKYVNNISENPAAMDLAIVSTLPIEEFLTWEMKASNAINTEPAPLIFRKCKPSPKEIIDKPFRDNLKSWFNFLDTELEQNNKLKVDTRDLLIEIIEEMGRHCNDEDIIFSDLLRQEEFQNKRSIKDKTLTNGTITIFLWKD